MDRSPVAAANPLLLPRKGNFMVIRILLFASSTLAVFCSTAIAKDEKSDIELVFRREYGGKPPHRSIWCDLKIRNRRDIPVWYVHPWHIDKRLVPKGRVEVQHWDPEYFVADGFNIKNAYWPDKKNNVGTFVRICSLAGEEFYDHFYAFRLPPGADFMFEGYQFDASQKNVDAIEFCEVGEIRINSRIALENWVPYPTMADKRVHMQDGTISNNNMNFDLNTSETRKDLRKDPVKLIELKILDRRKVPIQKLPLKRVEWTDKGWEHETGRPKPFGPNNPFPLPND
jgi:hypothetical protein